MAFGTQPTPTGLADPPIDDLMEHADSKYALAIFAAKRARQINSYFTQLNEGLLQNVGAGGVPEPGKAVVHRVPRDQRWSAGGDPRRGRPDRRQLISKESRLIYFLSPRYLNGAHEMMVAKPLIAS